ncbi:hypothetical protein H8952_18620, partial [Bacillus pumilus]|nr:hypothetical protein [Bacillus pumilus]
QHSSAASDVYKRQDKRIIRWALEETGMIAFHDRPIEALSGGPVSYTHLTLPTSAVACRSRWWPDH